RLTKKSYQYPQSYHPSTFHCQPNTTSKNGRLLNSNFKTEHDENFGVNINRYENTPQINKFELLKHNQESHRKPQRLLNFLNTKQDEPVNKLISNAIDLSNQSPNSLNIGYINVASQAPTVSRVATTKPLKANNALQSNKLVLTNPRTNSQAPTVSRKKIKFTEEFTHEASQTNIFIVNKNNIENKSHATTVRRQSAEYNNNNILLTNNVGLRHSKQINMEPHALTVRRTPQYNL
ncbi:MAG TPA: hypothetical protein DDZ41_00440, partial [Flavobacterium sp.]|nr:hypothetical protein [Flavobacterium sp.]